MRSLKILAESSATCTTGALISFEEMIVFTVDYPFPPTPSTSPFPCGGAKYFQWKFLLYFEESS